MILKRGWFAVCIAVLLFVIPFFWLKSGELDIGGDNSRLYFYDPQSFLTSVGIYSVDPQGTQNISPNQNLIPLLSIFSLIRRITHSSYLLITLEKSVKISASFWFIYLLTKEFLVDILKRRRSIVEEAAGILAGVSYAFSPAIVENMRLALLTHNQVFLNPLMFYLLLRYLKTNRGIYFGLILLVSVIFAPNFTLLSPPPLFAFYPLAIVFLYFYVRNILRKTISWRNLVPWILLLFGLNAFHLIPASLNVLDANSYLHARIIEASTNGNPGLNYFNAILSLAKVSNNLFLLAPSFVGLGSLLIMPLVVVGGFLVNSQNPRKKTFLFISIFSLITLFLVSANITNLGVNLYGRLFFIPGFGMFRNFFGQFQFIYTFFYAILFGVASGLIFAQLKTKYLFWATAFILILFSYRSEAFLTGKLVDYPQDYAKDVRSVVKMDPLYEETLRFIQTLPEGGKILTLPLSDFYMQVVHGINDGAYIGPSTISYLTDKPDFPAYQIIAPFSEALMRLSREKKYVDIKNLLISLNIRYIFHNSDPQVYDSTFPGFPYSYMRTSLPKTQQEYADFISRIADEKIYQNGPYILYKIKDSAYIPLLTIPQTIHIYQDDGKAWDTENKSFFATDQTVGPKDAFVLDSECQKFLLVAYCKDKAYVFQDVPPISFTKINPTKYRITLKNTHSPFILIFSNSHNSSWKLYQASSTKKAAIRWPMSNLSSLTQQFFADRDIFETLTLPNIADKRHFTINGYANAWLILPSDLASDTTELILETNAQRVFYLSLIVSLLALVIFLVWGVFLLKNKSRVI